MKLLNAHMDMSFIRLPNVHMDTWIIRLSNPHMDMSIISLPNAHMDRPHYLCSLDYSHYQTIIRSHWICLSHQMDDIKTCVHIFFNSYPQITLWSVQSLITQEQVSLSWLPQTCLSTIRAHTVKKIKWPDHHHDHFKTVLCTNTSVWHEQEFVIKGLFKEVGEAGREEEMGKFGFLWFWVRHVRKRNILVTKSYITRQSFVETLWGNKKTCEML